MNEQLVIFLVGQAIIFLGTGVWAYSTLAQRMTRVETYFEIMGKRAAKILLSPHTPELDEYLQKYVDEKMTYGDWTKLLELCDLLEGDKVKPKEERTLAAIVAVECRHVLKLHIDTPHKHVDL
jgi:hypothetical protein